MSTSALTRRPTIYVGPFIHTPTLGALPIQLTGAIAVSETGIITHIFTDVAADAAESTLAALTTWTRASFDIVRAPTTTSGATAFFFPGFIDTHTHASQYPNTGIFGSATLLDWLQTYTFPLESSFRSLPRARRVYARVVSRALSHGTTAAAYYATVHVAATNALADECLARGQRALVGRVCMDRLSPEDYRDESPEAAVHDTRATMAHMAAIDPAGALVRPVITPRFAPSCSDACLEALGALHAETGAHVQTHISENLPEVALVKELFPRARDYASVYADAGLLTDKTILAHAVHLSDAEVSLIAARGTGIAHCPASNTCLTSGAARVRRMLQAGVPVGLGTDMSGGYSPSILEMVRQALGVSRHVAMGEGDAAKLSVAEALYLATKGGAAVMGLGETAGSFEVGMEWDAQLVVLNHVSGEEGAEAGSVGAGEAEISDSPVDIFGWESWEDRIAKWVYCGDDRNTVAVWVKGRLVHSTQQYKA